MPKLTACQDCGAIPGYPHDEGCDTARCLRTGMQRLQCGVRPVFALGEYLTHEEYDPHPGEDCGQDIWTGIWPGEEDCIRLGWFARFIPGATPCWVPCSRDAPEAVPDLNRLVTQARWDRERLCWDAR